MHKMILRQNILRHCCDNERLCELFLYHSSQLPHWVPSIFSQFVSFEIQFKEIGLFCNFILHTSSFTLAEWPPRDRSRRCKHPQIFLRIKRRSPESNTVGTLKEPRPIDCTKPRGIDLLGTPQFYLVLSWWTHLLLSPRKRLNRINHYWKKGAGH